MDSDRARDCRVGFTGLRGDRVSVLVPTMIDMTVGESRFTVSDFQLLQWKHARRLEKQGLTMSRGRKVSTHLRKLAGLKRTASIDSLIELVENLMTEIETAKQAGTVERVPA